MYTPLVNQKVAQYGYITKEPSISSSGNQILVFRPDGYAQQLRMSLYNETSVRKGDYVYVTGEIHMPENFSSFNYIQYLKQDNIYAEIKKAQIVPLRRQESALHKIIRTSKEYIKHAISKHFSKDASGVMLGMLIGDDSKLSKSTKTDFKNVGLSHVLVVSGFNLTVLAGSLSMLCLVLPRKSVDVISLAVIWFFVCLVGFDASVVRAAIMVSLLLVARLLGRMSYSYVTLAYAVAVMSIVNPLQSIYDIGFQLSVCATLGVICAHKMKMWYGHEGWFADIMWSSGGALVMTLGIIAYYFQTLSIVALPVNILIVPLVPWIMLAGCLSVIPVLGVHIAQVINSGLELLLQAVHYIAMQSYSVTQLRVSGVAVICYYVLLYVLWQIVINMQKRDLKNNPVYDRIVKIKL